MGFCESRDIAVPADTDTHINTHITFARIGEIRPIYEYPYGVTDCNEPLYPVWSQSVAGYG